MTLDDILFNLPHQSHVQLILVLLYELTKGLETSHIHERSSDMGFYGLFRTGNLDLKILASYLWFFYYEKQLLQNFSHVHLQQAIMVSVENRHIPLLKKEHSQLALHSEVVSSHMCIANLQDEVNIAQDSIPVFTALPCLEL